MERFYRPSPRDLGRDFILAALIGCVIGVVLWIGDGGTESWWTIPAGAWIGVWIYGIVITALLAFSRLLARPVGWGLYAILAPLLFLASALGFYLGVNSLPWLDPLFELVAGESPPWLFIMFDTPDWDVMLSFAGSLGLVMGLLFFRYELLKARLRTSIDRLKERELAEKELATARELQQRMLGPATHQGPGYRIAARNRPARYVAGDFYDVSLGAEGSVGLIAADVSGKGIAASLVMASVKGRLSQLIGSANAAEILIRLNEDLVAELAPREFVALCCVRYSPGSGEFELANAGLPDPYLLARDQAPRPLAVAGPRLPLGVRSGVAYESARGRLEPGQRLLLLTDGLPEAPLSDGTPLGYGEFEKLIGQDGTALEAWLADLFERAEARTTQPLEDDWTALALERTE